MFGTTTLAEVKRKLIARLGYLPDLPKKNKGLAKPKEESANCEMSDVEKDLDAMMTELERSLENNM